MMRLIRVVLLDPRNLLLKPWGDGAVGSEGTFGFQNSLNEFARNLVFFRNVSGCFTSSGIDTTRLSGHRFPSRRVYVVVCPVKTFIRHHARAGSQFAAPDSS